MTIQSVNPSTGKVLASYDGEARTVGAAARVPESLKTAYQDGAARDQVDDLIPDEDVLHRFSGLEGDGGAPG
jgi:hypothetical protein